MSSRNWFRCALACFFLSESSMSSWPGFTYPFEGRQIVWCSTATLLSEGVEGCSITADAGANADGGSADSDGADSDGADSNGADSSSRPSPTVSQTSSDSPPHLWCD